jgi:hypothetical protein
MSRYRDLQIHGLLDSYVPQSSMEYVWAMGAAGPFGCVFEANDRDSAPLIWKHYSVSYFPQLKTQSKSLPVQCDGYNCGIFVVLNIMDLVITQWNKIWRLEDLWSDTESQQEKESYLSEKWLDLLRERKFATLPDIYGIGKAFVSNPSTTEGKVYKKLCDYM